MSNEEFIQQHLRDDVRSLALKRMPEGVDATWCLQQIEGWQLALKKLPQWAATTNLWFPPRLSLEQCSSELTALYKRDLILRLLPDPAQRTKIIDFTGGFGVDFSYLAPSFQHAVYIERQEVLCNVARHNFPLLNLPNAEVVCTDFDADSELLNHDYSLIYLDPARRDTAGRKVVAISDCTPDVTSLQERLTSYCHYMVIKFSPMLDITQALREIKNVCEVHVISVHGECKELLLVVKGCLADTENQDSETTFHCTNLDSNDSAFATSANEIRQSQPSITTKPLAYLFEPNASILKAGAQDALACKLNLMKIHPASNLFFCDETLKNYPGRTFRVIAWSDFSKKSIKQLLSDTPQANLTIRNFPSTVAELRKKLKLREGGSTYLFATTLADGSHALIKCEK